MHISVSACIHPFVDTWLCDCLDVCVALSVYVCNYAPLVTEQIRPRAGQPIGRSLGRSRLEDAGTDK